MRRKRYLGEAYTILLVAVELLFLYIGIAEAVYFFHHPELTATERLLEIWDAICWR